MNKQGIRPVVMLILLAALLVLAAGCGAKPVNNGDNAASGGSAQTDANGQNTTSGGSAQTDANGKNAASGGSAQTDVNGKNAASGGSSQSGANGNGTAGGDTGASEGEQNFSDPNDPIVTIEMDSGKTIKIELYPKVAPNTVNNFISLVKKGFYEGTVFHRVIPAFMIQGGDPEGTGVGGPGYSIKGEFSTNGFQNDLKHTRGVISMARTQDMDSAGSQFFIMVAAAPSLDGQYAAFGKVIEGMDTVDEIVNLPTGAQDRPLDPPVMKKVTVDTKGIEYKEPETVK